MHICGPVKRWKVGRSLVMPFFDRLIGYVMLCNLFLDVFKMVLVLIQVYNVEISMPDIYVIDINW